ncbi:MAG: FecR domain-containing protein [Terriglobia bacterium]
MSGRRTLGWVAAILLLAGVGAFAAGRQEGLRPLGFVAAKGEVRIDQQATPSGTAFFAGDVITTGSASVAIMHFQSGTAAMLSADSELAVSGGANPTAMNLRKGTVAIRNEGLETERVSVLGSTVLVRGEAGYPALCKIALVGNSAGIFAEQGHVEVRGKGGPVVLAPGKHLQVGPGGPQAAGQPAGKVANAIPEETVQHPGQTAELPLKLADPVVWEDTVRTLKTGRVRIALLDGSFLNVGARSMMKIVKHDTQSQQTQIELQLGRLRGEVVKITKPGGSMQVKTQTAVIGVVGTIFNVHALNNLTKVWCVNGTVTVQSLNPAFPGAVTLQPGQTTTVPKNGPPSGASPASGSQVGSEIGQTNVGEALSQELSQAMQSLGVTTGQAAAGGVQAGANLANGLATGAGATSAALGGAAAVKAGDAKDSAASAARTLQGAVDTSNEAAQSAGDAVSSSNNAVDGVQILTDILSPGGPGCVCL